MTDTRQDDSFSRPMLALAFLAALALALAARHLLMANTDVSWLITTAQRLLDGKRLYIDIIELNPPMSVYLYAPGAALGRLLSLRPQIAVDGLTFALAFASVVWAGRLLPREATAFGRARALLAPLAFGLIVILPAAGFSQREHVALILFLPWLALAIRRGHGAPVSAGAAIAAGLAGGLVMAIKPHFALAFALASLAAALSSARWRVVFALENIVAGCVVVAYAVFAAWAYPSYLSDVRPIIELYLSVRTPVMGMLFGEMPLFALMLVVVVGWLAWTRGQALRAPWIVVTGAAILGFLAAAILQGKGWPYHFLPAFILIGLLLVALGASTPGKRGPDAVVLALALLFCALAWRSEATGIDTAPLQKPLAAVKPHPRVMALASDSAVAFPTIPAIGGVWVDQAFIGWVPYYAAGIAGADGFDPSRLPALRAMVGRQRRLLAADLRGRKPDAILIERKPFDFVDWAGRDAELAGLLACFQSASHTIVGEPGAGGQGIVVEVWAPRGSPELSAACLAGVTQAP